MNKKEPLVSIIVPNYNHSKFLEERMQSILNQKFEDYEIILLDDASTDNSLEILNKYSSNPKVSALIVNQKNSGSPFSQWGKGIKHAKGKYIWLAESDDSSTPEFLNSMVEILEQNPDVVVAYSGCDTIDENGEPLNIDFNHWDNRKMRKRIGSYKVFPGEKFIRKNLYWSCYIYNASATLFRRDKISEGMFDDSIKMKNAGDWLFWNKLVKTGKIAEVYKKLHVIRRHANCATEKALRNGNMFMEDTKVIAYIERNNKIGRYRKLIRHALFIKIVRRHNLDEGKKREILDNFYQTTGGGLWEFRLERLHRVFTHFIPGLMSLQNDRL